MKHKMLKAPTKKEKIKIRSLIVIGLASIVNFFYWFLDFNLIEQQVLYWMLMSLILFDTFRLIYIWYHYWAMSVPIKPVSDKAPTVDVFTTYFPGEPIEMLKDTLLAIQQMDYEHTTYLCDEADDANLKQFCLEHQIIHVTRSNRIDAKAGNINNALKQAKGEICLILDPDHIPHKDFLTEIIPYFDDPKIGFVQTVQSYYNIYESPVARAAAEQTFHFYGPVMMCMNSYGTVNAIGANCVFRRTALDAIGGHAAGLSEDMHTAMKLHADGWKSIYVPKVLSAGLAPDTLTSYFKQQLKWSRGTLELLVTAFPKLFSKLTFRQKLHYGILPFHYLTGLFFLISILIPIISLVTSSTPWRGNVINFGLITLPVIVSILGIRFYVQKWVINKGERGLHLLGGLLMQITWGIYIIGFIYTIIRKKVPYLPTVKNDENKTNFYIVLPNLVVGVICIFAIVYGLYRDFTPFSIFMSGFALWNAMIMFYTFHFAYQLISTDSEDIQTSVNKFNNETKVEKIVFFIWQKTALVVLGFVLILSGYFNYRKQEIKNEGFVQATTNHKATKYVGVFAPVADNGISDLSQVSQFSKSIGQDVDIVSFYIAWNSAVENSFPEAQFHKVYEQEAIPLITWEPWVTSFNKNEQFKGHVFDSISAGYFDSFILDFATRLKALNRPVFLRFAHEFDNSFYPWYDERVLAAENFKSAWIHTWSIFDKAGADNVTWVFNPWKAENLQDFFPGNRYVDWIGVNILNYARYDQQDRWNDFSALYHPFHEEIKQLGNYPVMISEFGTYNDPGHQKDWLEHAMKSLNNNYKEINAIVYFNSKVDDNMPDGYEGDSYIDWTIADVESVDLTFKEEAVPSFLFKRKPVIEAVHTNANNKMNNLKNVRGVNIKSGQKWNQDYHVMTRKNLEANFDKIKKLGLNTIKYTSNLTYDYNVIKISNEFNLNVALGFWIPDRINFIKDSVSSAEIMERIVDLVEKHKDDENIISWDLQNDIFSEVNSHYAQPIRSYHLNAYTIWLQQLTKKIKAIDPIRPIIIDYSINSNNADHANSLLKLIPDLDGLGLIIKNTSEPELLLQAIQSLNVPYVYSGISANMLKKFNSLPSLQNFYVENWQDQHQIDKLTFDGLIDRKGRFKPNYFELKELLGPAEGSETDISIRILKGLDLIYPGNQAYYYAMVYNDVTGWERVESDANFKMEWALVKSDGRDNYITIRDVGHDPDLLLDIPENYHDYRLLLSIIKNGKVISSMSTLNTPYND